MRCYCCNELTENYNPKTNMSICTECDSIVADTLFDYEFENNEEFILEEDFDGEYDD